MIQKEIRRAIETGKVVFGREETIKSAKLGKSKLIVVSKNCPYAKTIKYYSENFSLPVYEFDGDSKKLGAACKKPFPISALSVIDPGKSKILELK